MAIYATPVDSDLILAVQAGTDQAGNPVYNRVRYSRLKATAADQDVYDVAAAIAGLVAYPLAAVERQTVSRLTSA